MGLHGTAALAVHNPQRVTGLRAIELGEFAQAGDGTQGTTDPGPEKTHGGLRALAQYRGNIHGNIERNDQWLPTDCLMLAALDIRNQACQDYRHGVNNRRLMHAIKFLIVNLVGILHCRQRGRNALAGIPPARTRLAGIDAPPLPLRKCEQLRGKRYPRPGNSHAHGIEHKNTGRRHRLG